MVAKTAQCRSVVHGDNYLAGRLACLCGKRRESSARPTVALGNCQHLRKILSNIYYGESLKKIRAAIAPRPLEIRIYGPDTFLDAARNDQFDMSIASYGLTSIMLRQTGGARVLTAVNKRFPDPYAGNGAAIIVRSDRQDINTIEDLPNKSLG